MTPCLCFLALLLLATPSLGQLPQSIASLLAEMPSDSQGEVGPALTLLDPAQLAKLQQADQAAKISTLCMLLEAIGKPLPSFCTSPPPASPPSTPPSPVVPPAPSTPPNAPPPATPPPVPAPISPPAPIVPVPAPIIPVPAPIVPAPAPTVPAPAPLVPAPAPAPTCSDEVDLSGLEGGFPIGNFGSPNTQVYGQVMTAPHSCNSSESTTLLLSFGFVIAVPTDLEFEGVLYEWDNQITSVVGPALFVSDAVTSPSPSNVLVTFDPPNPIELDPGTQYVIFLNALPAVDGVGTMKAYSSTPTVYQGGSFVYYNSPPGDFSGQWSNIGEGVVASFKITYE